MLLEAPPQQESPPAPTTIEPPNEFDELAVVDETDDEDDDDETAPDTDTEDDDANGSDLSPIESLLKIRQARESCRQLLADWNEAKADAKAAKEMYERAVIRLNSLIDQGPKIVATATKLADGEIDASPEAWRSVTIEELGLQQGVCDALRKAEICTLGAVADWTNEKRLDEIKGIGQSKAEIIEQACEQYWKDHPEFTQEKGGA